MFKGFLFSFSKLIRLIRPPPPHWVVFVLFSVGGALIYSPPRPSPPDLPAEGGPPLAGPPSQPAVPGPAAGPGQGADEGQEGPGAAGRPGLQPAAGHGGSARLRPRRPRRRGDAPQPRPLVPSDAAAPPLPGREGETAATGVSA